MMGSVVVATAAAALAAAGRTPIVPQTLGTWLPNYGDNITNFIADPATAAATFATMRSAGANTAYVDAFHAGVTAYPSPTWAACAGVSWNDTDYLSFTVPAALAAGLKPIAWFEWGTMLGPAIQAGCGSNWSIGDNGGFTYGDPSSLALQDFIINITLDAIAHAPSLAGIQFDDHFCWPNWLPASGGPSQAEKQAILTAFAAKLYAAVKAARPDMMVSLSPLSLPNAQTVYNVPWNTWLAGTWNLTLEDLPEGEAAALGGYAGSGSGSGSGVDAQLQARHAALMAQVRSLASAGTPIIEDAVVQMYCWDTESFNAAFDVQTAAVPASMIPRLKAGILINNGAQTSANMTAMMDKELQAASDPATPWGGQVLWYARGLVLCNTSTVAAVWAQAQGQE